MNQRNQYSSRLLEGRSKVVHVCCALALPVRFRRLQRRAEKNKTGQLAVLKMNGISPNAALRAWGRGDGDE
jgi:hypothetical protein